MTRIDSLRAKSILGLHMVGIRWCWMIVIFVGAIASEFGIGVSFGQPHPPQPKVAAGRIGQMVNPMIGTGGVFYLCGNNFPGATLPFGMVRLSPDTISLLGKRATNSSGYFYSDPGLLGFSHTRLAGTGATDGGNFLVIPYPTASTKGVRRGLNIPFSHENEVAFPGYYGLRVEKLGITAELTATRRVGVHRYTFDDVTTLENSGEATAHLLMHVSSVLGKGTAKGGTVRIKPQTSEIEGSIEAYGTFSKRYGGLKVFFVGKLNRPLRACATWSGDGDQLESTEAQGDDIGVDLEVKLDESRSVELKVALSFVGIENARQNLEQEAAGIGFDEIQARAVEEWEAMLSRVQVQGGTETQRTIFHTALYHSLQMPTSFSDVDGRYTGFDRQVHDAQDFVYYTDMSLWDTFRTVHPLFNLIASREQRDMLRSLVKMAEQGGYLPRWPSGCGYSNSMFGTPADIVVSESYQKGIRDFDVEAAYEAMKKGALGPVTGGSRFSGREGIAEYLKHGYGPGDLMKKSVACSVEYSYADDAIARLARELRHIDDADLFEQHSRYYQQLFNPETQFFQPRDSRGTFLPFAPEMLTYVDFTGSMTHAYVEGSAWQWRWGVPSQASELISLFKSREYFVEQLEQFFARAPSGLGENPNPFYWQGNQPDLYAVYLFNAAGRPDLTQKWVRWILESKYGPAENGLDGNDDGGTLSAWYVLSSLGIFPAAGTDRYELGSPLWDRAEIRLQRAPLIIEAENAASDHPYVSKVWLNGQLLDRTWIRHAEIVEGGTLRFEMAAEPNR